MGTRSRSGFVNPDDGSITSIYCHWDGYPEHHLPILTGHYTTNDKVADLLALGSLSSLGPEVGERHDFDYSRQTEAQKRMCTSHLRDRGDLSAVAKLSGVRSEFMRLCYDCDAEWFYLFDNGGWEHGQP